MGEAVVPPYALMHLFNEFIEHFVCAGEIVKPDNSMDGTADKKALDLGTKFRVMQSNRIHPDKGSLDQLVESGRKRRGPCQGFRP